ncbi:hypothetical protein KSP40_PGU020335 [Platanthera guangdongensis]|uniref:Uncharacterized protein n=1 Tax=Platanthera guangdongensis TaxID=2320717 RepID=A0ABR2LCU4_9ASPA
MFSSLIPCSSTSSKGKKKMAEEKLSNLAGEMNTGGAYPMFFGVSCAFIALQFLSAMDGGANAELGHQKSCFAEIMLRGSAQLLGVLFEKAQKIHEDLREKERVALSEVMELKRIRADDAKANERVMSIFSTREQSWQAEIRRLLNQIRSLSGELSSAKSKIEEMVSDMKVKDDLFEEQGKKMAVLEEKLLSSERELEELRERANKEDYNHMLELRRHKAAFTELVSDQRRLEGETARLLREAASAKEELEEALEQKEEAMAMVESLSEEFVRLQKDADQKGKIVSAMIRKAKHDTAEKQALLKEVKITRAKKKQAELDGERWRSLCESKLQKKNSSKEAGTSGKRSPELQSTARIDLRARLLMYLDTDSNGEHEFPFSEKKIESLIKPSEFQHQYLNENNDNLGKHYYYLSSFFFFESMANGQINVQEIQDWVRLETKKYTAILEEKHYSEIEAFAEQLRIRDEKLEDLHWRLLSTELDSKTLQSQIEGLDGSLAQLTDENLKLETLLENRERDLNSLTARQSFHCGHFPASNHQPPLPVCESGLRQSFDLLMKGAKKKNREVQNLFEVERNFEEKHENAEEIVLVRQFKPGMEAGMTVGIGSFPSMNLSDDQSNDEDSSEHQPRSGGTTSRSREEEIEEERELHTRQKQRASDAPPMFKMNIQALGVSFKIKRASQQILILENLAAGDEAAGSNGEKKPELKGLTQVISFLNKQLKRYQSLEEKTEALCGRMLETSGGGASRRRSDAAGDEENTGELERFLEETFQLQRFVVATGQKLMELQPRIKSSLSSGEEEDWRNRFNLGQFLDVVRNLFMDVQRGLEVRIARIIGDIEGTLASDGILRR